MNERDKKLIQSDGPKTYERINRILHDLLNLPSDIYSVMTDDEWKSCGESMLAFRDELEKVRRIVYIRMKEAKGEIEMKNNEGKVKVFKLYGLEKPPELVGRFKTYVEAEEYVKKHFNSVYEYNIVNYDPKDYDEF